MSHSTNVATLVINSHDWMRVSAFSQKSGLIRDTLVLFILHSNLFFGFLLCHYLFIDSSLSKNMPRCMNK